MILAGPPRGPPPAGPPARGPPPGGPPPRGPPSVGSPPPRGMNIHFMDINTRSLMRVVLLHS